RQQILPSEVQNVIDNIGLPFSGINLSYSNSAPVGTSDADILVTLSAKHHPTDDYIHQLRLKLPKQFPGVSFAFLPADMTSQILNFGLPAPIDVQVVGNDLEGNQRYANALLGKLKYVTGTADLRIQQPFDQPYLRLRVERTKADRKSTRLNSSHGSISYAVFCLKKKKTTHRLKRRPRAPGEGSESAKPMFVG